MMSQDPRDIQRSHKEKKDMPWRVAPRMDKGHTGDRGDAKPKPKKK